VLKFVSSTRTSSSQSASPHPRIRMRPGTSCASRRRLQRLVGQIHGDRSARSGRTASRSRAPRHQPPLRAWTIVPSELDSSRRPIWSIPIVHQMPGELLAERRDCSDARSRGAGHEVAVPAVHLRTPARGATDSIPGSPKKKRTPPPTPPHRCAQPGRPPPHVLLPHVSSPGFVPFQSAKSPDPPARVRSCSSPCLAAAATAGRT